MQRKRFICPIFVKSNHIDMKKAIYLLAAAVVLLTLGSCSRYQTASGDTLKTKIYTLDNGLKIYMSVNKEQPRIQTFIAVKVGSKNDPSETTGLAHYFEHLMFKGTQSFGTTDYAAEKPMLDQIEQLFETYRGTTDEAARKEIYHKIDSVSYEASKLAIPNEYDKLMATIGADGSNAWTSADETVYTEDIPSNEIDNWARIQADRFRNGVIRGFHTELEAIYEEKNMSLTDDSEKVFEAVDQALFPHHPYGRQTTLGSQEHLKNPSITNVKKYHDIYYVPNNIAICVSGDFNPDEMVAAIKKYFGDWKPNPDIPALKYEKESPITTPVVKDVYGNEAENMAIAWRLPGAGDLKVSAVAQIAAGVLSNGQAGLIDIDVNQQQKALSLYGGCGSQPDYSFFMLLGRPKRGQTLEQLRDIALAETAKLRSGDFSDSLIISTVNNLKLDKMKQLESNSSRAMNYVDAFINGIDWKDACREMDRLSSVKKEDVVNFAKEYLGENAYAVVYKHLGEDNTVKKISAPPITPIVTNRDLQSQFLKDIQKAPVKPVAPVFVDFTKDMSTFSLSKGAEVLYKHNEINDVFTLNFIFNTGSENDPALSMAGDYVSYLGTPDMSAEKFASEMYNLACSYGISVGSNQTVISLTGLGENMPEAVKMVENLMLNARGDESILANVKGDTMKARFDAKKSQDNCYSALRRYSMYGPEFIKRTTMTDAAVESMTSEELLGKVKGLFTMGHEILYYGPMSQSTLKGKLAECHKVSDNAVIAPEKFTPKLQTASNRVIMAQYDAKQIYFIQYSNSGVKFDAASEPEIELYNEYFGGGMNTIVFQEMREARGLAYSAWARLNVPYYAGDVYSYNAFIATQNDKMRNAIETFSDIIEKMPESEASFAIAREALLNRLRTQRTTGIGVLSSYLSCRRLGIGEPMDRQVYEKAQNLTLSDIKAAQQKWVKGRFYDYCILGDIKDLDTKYLETLGPVKTVSLEDIFGY